MLPDSKTRSLTNLIILILSFINIHKHGTPSGKNILELINVNSRFDSIPESGFYSAGLHPWYLSRETAAVEWEAFQRAVAGANVLAVGECGLDRVCKTDWELQEEYFKRQIDFSATVKKPLIIHCLRAFDETVSLLKANKVRVPVIFHGFNKSLALAEKLLQEGYYLSFGKHLLNAESIREVFRRTPGEKLFLETDAADISIEEIYSAAAEIRQVSVDQLSAQIEANAVKVFGEKIVVHHE